MYYCASFKRELLGVQMMNLVSCPAGGRNYGHSGGRKFVFSLFWGGWKNTEFFFLNSEN